MGQDKNTTRVDDLYRTAVAYLNGLEPETWKYLVQKNPATLLTLREKISAVLKSQEAEGLLQAQTTVGFELRLAHTYEVVVLYTAIKELRTMGIKTVQISPDEDGGVSLIVEKAGSLTDEETQALQIQLEWLVTNGVFIHMIMYEYEKYVKKER